MNSSQEAEKAIERGTEQVRVLVVDDHAAVREGVKMILARDREIAVIGESSNGDAHGGGGGGVKLNPARGREIGGVGGGSNGGPRVGMAGPRGPDGVLMDGGMRGLGGFGAPRRDPGGAPGMAVILYTAFGERGL